MTFTYKTNSPDPDIFALNREAGNFACFQYSIYFILSDQEKTIKQ